MKEKLCPKNEDGAVLVVALIMLVLLTLLGISITTTSEVEIQIAGNERRYKDNLYTAEAAAMECAQTMDAAASLDPDTPNDWLGPLGSVTEADARDDDFWDDTTDDINPATVSASLDPDGNTQYIAVHEGVPEGESFQSGIQAYTIYGRRYDAARPNQGRSIVKVGFRCI